MTTEIYIKLEQVRDRLRELGNSVANLAQNYADILDNSDLSERLREFRQVYQESVDRLDNPNLSIATIGTTSSGKSTIVNALIGRKIAPIEAGEMSGGVLKIKHSKEFKLAIEATEGATWETGIWSDLSDETIYDRIRNAVMLPYHQTRQQKDCFAPQVTAYVPILPAVDSGLLGLPEGIGVELIDLPGLKSIQDKDNLKIIQEQVCKAFSIVSLDYLQVDDKHRKRLLEELKRVVEYLQGRTDSMIFILNRVDQRGVDDMPIEERIAQLKLEIQETLSLNETPDIIPLSGRILYYAQCAWGTVSMNDNSSVDAATRLNFLSAMLEDCSNIIRLHISHDKKLKNWFRELEDRVDEQDVIDDETMRKVIYHVLDWSGGKQLWECMRNRVRESFSELVILPVLIEVFNTYDSLVKAIDAELNIRKIDDREKLETTKKQIAESSQCLYREIENIRDRFGKDVKIIIESLKKDDQSDRSSLAQKGYQGFETFFDAVREIVGDLIQNLITPVRDAFAENKGTYELEEDLSEIVTPPKAKAIAKAYDLVNRKLTGFERDDSGYFVKRVREDDEEGVRSLEHAEKAVRSLYYAMRQAISARAEFLLQGQARKFKLGLQSLVEELINEIKNVVEQKIPYFALNEVIIADFETSVFHQLPTLPENIFEFSDSIEQNSTSQKEKVGTTKEKQTYTEGSCFKQEKTKVVSKDIYDNINYQELKLPDAQNMARQWADGIDLKKNKLWDLLDEWINSYLDFVIKEVNRSIARTMKNVEQVVDRQLQNIDRDLVRQIDYWDKFESQKDLVTVIRQQLEQEAH